MANIAHVFVLFGGSYGAPQVRSPGNDVFILQRGMDRCHKGLRPDYERNHYNEDKRISP